MKGLVLAGPAPCRTCTLLHLKMLSKQVPCGSGAVLCPSPLVGRLNSSCPVSTCEALKGHKSCIICPCWSCEMLPWPRLSLRPLQ